MDKKIFYEKVGRRYKPVYEYDQTLMDSMPKGAHLICVYPGGRSTRYSINVAYAPQRTPITPGQKKAWEKLAKEFGDELCPLTYGSTRDHAEAAVKAMQDEAEKLLSNPSVKKAYEHFLLVCELTKEETNE